MIGVVEFSLPVYTPSKGNERGSWKRHFWKHTQPQRDSANAAAMAYTSAADRSLALIYGATIKLVRVSPRELDDDNLRSALKACRDGIADMFGTTDRNPLLVWEYGQAKGKPPLVRVTITIRPPVKRGGAAQRSA
jgi:hypothetical protein